MQPDLAMPDSLKRLADAYNLRGRNVALLTGNVDDLMRSRKAGRYVTLEQLLYQEMGGETKAFGEIHIGGKFSLLSLDLSTGIGVYDESDLQNIALALELADTVSSKVEERFRDDSKRSTLQVLKDRIAGTRYQPLPALVLLKQIAEAVNRVLDLKIENAREVRPLLVVVRFAGALFPAGEFDRLSELDRQRLVTFLDWVGSPRMAASHNLVVLIAGTRSEVNSKILELPVSEHIEIELPDAGERERFTAWLEQSRRLKDGTALFTFERGLPSFVEDAAGLRLTGLEDLMSAAARAKRPVSRADVLAETNRAIQAALGDIIKVTIPEHTPDDIIGYQNTQTVLRRLFERCEALDSAVSAVLVCGPNGVGKTFQLEAFAAVSGRIVIELAGLRGMYFGQTDRFFELLRWQIRTYGKILILVDEAHTAFGSVHKSDTHETERRLGGNIIKMMGDPRMRGKVLWALMTSRPDELDPDVKSRAPIQIPIFDLEGEARAEFLRMLLSRRKVEIAEGEFDEVLKLTGHYSPRDLDNMVREVKAATGQSAIDTIRELQLGTAILRARKLQELVAAQHCSYRTLLPERLREKVEDPDELQREIEALKLALHY